MNHNGEHAYLFQGTLECFEAESILPRLDKEKIRFRIEADSSSHDIILKLNYGAYRDSRIKLFVHPADIPAWHKIREEFFPAER